jgi:hypothetical protein
MKYSNRRERAMTLLELIVVMGAMTVLIALTATIIHSVSDLWLELQERSAAARDGATAVRKIGDELRMALAPDVGWKMDGTDGTKPLLNSFSKLGPFSKGTERDYGDKLLANDALSFSSQRLRFLNRQHPGGVRYAIKHDEKAGVVGLVRRSCELNQSLYDAQDEIVSKYIVSLDISYIDEKGKESNGWTAKDKLPHAVRITVGTLPRRTSTTRFDVSRYTTVVTLPSGTRIAQ